MTQPASVRERPPAPPGGPSILWTTGACPSKKRRDWCSLLPNSATIGNASGLKGLPHRHYLPKLNQLIISCDNIATFVALLKALCWKKSVVSKACNLDAWRWRFQQRNLEPDCMIHAEHEWVITCPLRMELPAADRAPHPCGMRWSGRPRKRCLGRSAAAGARACAVHKEDLWRSLLAMANCHAFMLLPAAGLQGQAPVLEGW